MIEKTNICFRGDVTKKTFCSELLSYTKDNNNMFSKLEEPHERNTRSVNFTIEDAHLACEMYIKALGSLKNVNKS